ncbi:MAG: hypothetical protein PHE58_04650 [Candidatus Omnitrophica bacterium]|nr:hypothetical protein [Candidatus Omnitrophota bacterium]
MKKKALAKKKSTVKKVIKKKPAKAVKPAAKKKPVLKKKLPIRASKKPVKKAVKAPRREEGVLIGDITHYFPKVRAAVVKVKAPLSVGDTIKIKGKHTDFTQSVSSLQIDCSSITLAKKGDEIGLLVESRVREKDEIYRL